MPVAITAFYAALLTLLYATLSLKVAFFRKNQRVGLGDGGNPQARRLIRAHGNASEYIPIVLILMGLYELNGGQAGLLHGAGSTFFVARMLHAYGLVNNAGASAARFIGAALTFACLLGLAVLNGLQSLSQLLSLN